MPESDSTDRQTPERDNRPETSTAHAVKVSSAGADESNEKNDQMESEDVITGNSNDNPKINGVNRHSANESVDKRISNENETTKCNDLEADEERQTALEESPLINDNGNIRHVHINPQNNDSDNSEHKNGGPNVKELERGTSCYDNAPDGGWGWVVTFAAFMVGVILDGISFSFGLFFKELLLHFNESKSLTSWIISVLNGTYLGIGMYDIYT
jgi:hypothetical protein